MEEALRRPYHDERNKIVLKFAVTYPKQTMFFPEARVELSSLTHWHALLIQSTEESLYDTTSDSQKVAIISKPTYHYNTIITF